MSSNKLYVGNLPWSAREEQLNDLFSPYGEITDSVVIVDRATDRSKGFGFVTFKDASSAAEAAQALDGKGYDGTQLDDSGNSRPLRVNEAQEKSQSDRRSRY